MSYMEGGRGTWPALGVGQGVEGGPAEVCLRTKGWVMDPCRRSSDPWAGPGYHSPLGCWGS